MRIAIRHEGASINAYLAHPTDMSNSVLIAHIDHQLCQDFPSLFDLFKHMMTVAASNVCTRAFGEPNTINLEPAPEHEKAGHA
jgi:hypothetical protein